MYNTIKYKYTYTSLSANFNKGEALLIQLYVVHVYSIFTYENINHYIIISILYLQICAPPICYRKLSSKNTGSQYLYFSVITHIISSLYYL